jgi:hypothetical protein
LDRVARVLVMGTQRQVRQDVGALPPVDVVESIQELQPGDIALVYLGGLGPAPAEQPPIGVIDLVDDVDDLQPGDTALVYLPGAAPTLAAGVVDSVTPPDRKRATHSVTFTTPVTDDPTSTHLAVSAQVPPESTDSTGVLVHAYRLNKARLHRRALLAGHSVSGQETPGAATSLEPTIVFGTVGSVNRWGLTDPGHIISYTRPAFDDGSFQFPINLPSVHAFISGYRPRTP